jgi:hypothetical protein
MLKASYDKCHGGYHGLGDLNTTNKTNNHNIMNDGISHHWSVSQVELAESKVEPAESEVEPNISWPPKKKMTKKAKKKLGNSQINK